MSAKRKARPWPGTTKRKASVNRAATRAERTDHRLSDTPLRENRCLNGDGTAKKGYTSRADAKATARLFPNGAKPYLCPCGYFHLGHRSGASE